MNQTLRFKNSNQYNQMWQSLINVIPGIKQAIKTMYDKLTENKYGPVLFKKTKEPIYFLYIKNKSAIIFRIKKINNDIFFELTFNNIPRINFYYNGNCQIIIDNIEDFNNLINDWYEQLLRSPEIIYHHQTYFRKGIYSIEDILSKTFLDRNKGKDDLINFDGDLIHMASERYKTFLLKGTTCVSCGLEAQYFAKERSGSSNIVQWHFNLYGLDENDKEILFTKDHVLPKSKGGKNHVSNFQTMCYKCNSKKGSDYNG